MKPNVLIIHADQLRQDCIEPYGNVQVKTPNLSLLANDSVTFENHFCPYPVCTPSRYSLLTGLYAHQHLGWSNKCTLPGGLETFPKRLRAEGWNTAAVGKAHFTPTYMDAGFDRLILAEQDGDGRFEDDYHRYLMERGLLDDIDLTDQRSEYRANATKEYYESFGSEVSDLPEEHHSTTWITGRALDELDNWRPEGGNLLMVGYIKPHHPFDPPARYAQMYDADSIDVLPGYTPEVPAFDYGFNQGYFNNAELTTARLKKMTALYYAAITQIDDCIGMLVKRLKEQGAYDRTMILFTSDHGDYLGFHHMALKSNHMYDPLMKIPLIIKYPHQKQGGEHRAALSGNTDIAGEILSAALESPESSGPSRLHTGRQYVIAEFKPDGEACHYMVRSERYKLFVLGSAENLALYDLQNDPFELNSCHKSPEYAGVLQKHLTFLFESLAFNDTSKVHLDFKAPLCKCYKPNPAQREAVMRFCREKSKAAR